MKPKKYNIVLRKNYTVRDEDKSFFAPVGEIIIFPESTRPDGSTKQESGIVKMHALSEEYIVFPQKDTKKQPVADNHIDYPDAPPIDAYSDIEVRGVNEVDAPDWETVKKAINEM